jgi:hypothetical protein
LSSRIALTKVSELPGYAEWLDSQKSRVLPWKISTRKYIKPW